MLVVRSGDDCPGAELERACSPAIGSSQSYLDLMLEAGQYFIQLDGYDAAAGPWQLNVFTAAL
jgi:hypothetical protein